MRLKTWSHLLATTLLSGLPVFGQTDVHKQIDLEKTIIEDKGFHVGEGWLDYSAIVSGSRTKGFSRDLGLLQLTNDNEADRHKVKVGQLYWDNMLFDDRLDIAVG